MRMILRINIIFAFFRVSASLNLKYFETITSIEESTNVKRDTMGLEFNKYLRFIFLNRSFHVSLKSGTSVLAQGFKSYLVQDNGRTEEFLFDQSNVYSGHLFDNTSVFVNAYKAEELWSIHIFADDDTYAVEPAYNLLSKDINPFNHSMFAYRASDIVESGGKCGVRNSPTFEGGHSLTYKGDKSENIMKGNGSQKKRDVLLSGNTCLIHAVGDYDFFKHRCNSNFVLCSSLIVSFINFADSIYKSSNFMDSDGNPMGSLRIQIARLDLYQTNTRNFENHSDEHPHFNSIKHDWASDTKLNSFAFFMSFADVSYCHHHLFTQFPMPERVLGLSYVAAACFVATPPRLQFSTGISSGEDIITGPLSSLQLNLVFAHGHNLGSEHDPATDECSQPDERGGEFLMWEMAVSGIHSNHKKLSPCSLRLIGSSLKSFGCLINYKSIDSFCGNGILDEEEECDSGFQSNNKCCDNHCKLKEGAICSETNKQCCVGCNVASNTTVCYDTGKAECKEISYCSGDSFDCPPSEMVADWTECIDGGVCYLGKCLSYCELKSIYENVTLQPCLCRDVENACKWCCFDASDEKNPGKCHPFLNNETLSDGRPCDFGFCKNGICRPQVVSAIRRIASFLNAIEISKLAEFMKTNMVTSVIVLTLLLWTPCFYLVSLKLQVKRCLCNVKSTNKIVHDMDEHPNEAVPVNEIDKSKNLNYEAVPVYKIDHSTNPNENVLVCKAYQCTIPNEDVLVCEIDQIPIGRKEIVETSV